MNLDFDSVSHHPSESEQEDSGKFEMSWGTVQTETRPFWQHLKNTATHENLPKHRKYSVMEIYHPCITYASLVSLHWKKLSVFWCSAQRIPQSVCWEWSICFFVKISWEITVSSELTFQICLNMWMLNSWKMFEKRNISKWSSRCTVHSRQSLLLTLVKSKKRVCVLTCICIFQMKYGLYSNIGIEQTSLKDNFSDRQSEKLY